MNLNKELKQALIQIIQETNHINSRKKPKYSAFGWFGGKYSHLNWLLPLLPKSGHYCEPFGGSAAVLLNRSPSPVETYNDLDGELVNFFSVLRKHPKRLIQAIALTPYSRYEFASSVKHPIKKLSSFERARRFYVRARQVRSGLAQIATRGMWAFSRESSRRNMSPLTSRWLGSIENLGLVAARLARVQIEHDNALSVIRRYDSSGTLFYCDPPYPHESRRCHKAYHTEMDDDAHRLLSYCLHNVQGKVALSGYRCPLLDKLYRDWQRIDAPKRWAAGSQSLRQESLWINYSL